MAQASLKLCCGSTDKFRHEQKLLLFYLLYSSDKKKTDPHINSKKSFLRL